MKTIILLCCLVPFFAACVADDTSDDDGSIDAEPTDGLTVDSFEPDAPGPDAGPELPFCSEVSDQCVTGQWYCTPCDSGGECSCNGQPEIVCVIDSCSN